MALTVEWNCLNSQLIGWCCKKYMMCDGSIQIVMNCLVGIADSLAVNVD
jgi:hypothetical protein